MHPNAEKWIGRHLRAGEARQFREELDIFLSELLGPLTDYRFRGLKAGYPFPHIPLEGILYLRYEKIGKRPVAFQLIGEPLKNGDAADRSYRKYLEQYNKLVLEGWAVLGFTSENLKDDPDICKDFMRRLFELNSGA
ncbi:hypothetical protein [Cohnella thermotolerans]|jgi:hypothetical protein|uniref:hypothetical protein n=1 Tax=Cohnella thermotolerans TaxID=329858 RepID=UPI0003FFA14C|nr:hypothetical protein [Cohnella thermotolerans]